MAIDGSFRLKAELKRFLRQVSSNTQLGYLADNMTEEEVVNAVAELLLHPKYTIPLLGCLRPIALKIVDRTVDLLQLVPDLKSNSDDSMVEFDEDKCLRELEDLGNTEVVYIIDYYMKRGKGLNLHEYACLAFSRALDLLPFLLGSVLRYFQFAPPPFQWIGSEDRIVTVLDMERSRLLNVARSSYRFLLAAPEVFITHWDWSCFLDLLRQCANLDVGENEELKRTLLDIRWCGVQILSMVLKLCDRATADFGLGSEDAFSCLLRWQQFCQDVSLEKAGWYLESYTEEKWDSAYKSIDLNQDHISWSINPCSTLSSQSFHEITQSKWNPNQMTW